MKDRVPAYPGRVTLRPVPGQADTYDMTRADQPSEPGSALNKANLLPDDVARSLWLDPADDPQVKDALKNISRVGDIKITTRTDLGEDWLLCNGDAILGDDFPGLKPLLPGQAAGKWDEISKPANISEIGTLVYFKGFWFAAGYGHTCYYASSLDGAWTDLSLEYAYRQAATNGDTIIVWGGRGSATNAYKYNWTRDVTGSWAEGSFGSMYLSNPTVYAVKNGYYLAKTVSNMNYTNDLSAGFTSTYNGATYYDDYVIVTSDTETAMFASEDRAGGRYKVMGDTPAVWTTYTVAGAVMNYVKCAAYVNGYYVIGKAAGVLYVTSNIRDPESWTPVSIAGAGNVSSINYLDGVYWVSAGNGYFSRSLFGGWKVMPEDVSQYISYGDNKAVSYNGTNNFLVAAEGNRALPAMSPDKAYAYIKAK